MAKKVSRKSRRRLMTFGIVSLFAIGYFCFTLFGYVYKYFSLKNEERSLNNELYHLNEEKAYLKNEMIKLNDPEYVVRYAKEKFLYSSEDEFVIRLNESVLKNEDSEDNDNKFPIIVTSILIFVSLVFVIHLSAHRKKYK